MAKVSYAEGVISALEYYTYEMDMARDFGAKIRGNDGNNYIVYKDLILLDKEEFVSVYGKFQPQLKLYNLGNKRIECTKYYGLGEEETDIFEGTLKDAEEIIIKFLSSFSSIKEQGFEVEIVFIGLRGSSKYDKMCKEFVKGESFTCKTSHRKF